MTSIRGAFRAHQQYISSGKLLPSLLRRPVFRAWERSHLQGANARAPKAIELEPLETERLLDQESAIIAAAKPYMRALSKAAGDDQHAAMLGDAHAVVLDVLGDDDSVHGPVNVPGPGSLLDEAACGANGIGTPLAEGGYVELVGPEHFIAGFHPFTCQGIPLRDTNGDIVGSLSVSVKRPDAAMRLREILVCAAHGIEMELLRRRLEEDIRRVVTMPDISDDLAENLRQDVMQALTAGRMNVEVAARVLGRQRTQDVSKLLQLANGSMEIFRRQGSLWHGLISTDTSNARTFDLNVLVLDLSYLLETERRLGAIALDTSALEPVSVMADPHATGRALFRLFLRAFDVARDGGSVKVSVRPTCDNQGEVRFDAIPAMNTPNPIHQPLSKTFLVGRQPQGVCHS